MVGLLRDESVDLIYLDPSFNSKASYNVLFKAPTGEHSQAADRSVRRHCETRDA